MYCHYCTYSILNGIGKQKVILLSSIATALIELVLIFILIGIPSINIYGYGISLIVTSIIGFLINLYYIGQVIELSFPIWEILILVLLTVLVYLVTTIISSIIPNTFIIPKVITIIVVAFSLFFVSSFLIRKSS